MDKALAFLTCAAVCASTAHAQDVDQRSSLLSQRFALQSRLKQERLYSGEIDGVIGPMMRRAIQEYAQENLIDPTFEVVAEHIMLQSHLREKREVSREEIEIARSHLEERLLDAESARYRDEYAFDVGDLVIVCGEVNGKNAYGAYTGFHVYQVSISHLDFGDSSRSYAVGDPLAPWVDFMCAYGTSFMAAIGADDE